MSNYKIDLIDRIDLDIVFNKKKNGEKILTQIKNKLYRISGPRKIINKMDEEDMDEKMINEFKEYVGKRNAIDNVLGKLDYDPVKIEELFYEIIDFIQSLNFNGKKINDSQIINLNNYLKKCNMFNTFLCEIVLKLFVRKKNKMLSSMDYIEDYLLNFYISDMISQISSGKNKICAYTNVKTSHIKTHELFDN
jgi:hypothetical protein